MAALRNAGISDADADVLRRLGSEFIGGRGVGPVLGVFETLKSLREPETRAALNRAIQAVRANVRTTGSLAGSSQPPSISVGQRTAVPVSGQPPQPVRRYATPPPVAAPVRATKPDAPDHVSRQDRTTAETAQMKAWSMKPTQVQRQAPLVEDHRGGGFFGWIFSSILGREL